MRHSGRKALPRKASPNHTQEPWPRGWHIPPRLPMAPSLELLLSSLPPPAPAILPNSTSGTSFRLPSPFPHSCLPLPHVLLPHLQASLVAFRTVSPTPGLGRPLPADPALNVSISHLGRPHFHPCRWTQPRPSPCVWATPTHARMAPLPAGDLSTVPFYFSLPRHPCCQAPGPVPH